jgi:hypothetical protein
MIQKFRLALTRNIINSLGFKTNRKIVVFESDDWGSIRIPSLGIQKILVEKRIISLDDAFSKYDALESETDLNELFNVLLAYKDKNGRPPQITANCVVANPNFERIKAFNFNEYFYEDITQTFARYPEHSRSFSLWHKGISENVFFPQYHGREHLNVDLWLKRLQAKDPIFIEAFNYQVFAANPNVIFAKGDNIMAALDYNTEIEKKNKVAVLSDGYKLFSSLMGYNSKSFIAPCYIWDSNLEEELHKMGVRYIQGSKFQNIPNLNLNHYTKKFHYTSQRNKFGQNYFVRNALFEPALNSRLDWVAECLKSINNAFMWKRPAIVGTHRLNFIGYLHPKNREDNLRMFNTLLDEITKKWPDVEFLNSSELGDTQFGICRE